MAAAASFVGALSHAALEVRFQFVALPADISGIALIDALACSARKALESLHLAAGPLDKRKCLRYGHGRRGF